MKRQLFIGLVFIAAALLVWGVAFAAPQGATLEARNIDCTKNDKLQALSCTYQIWRLGPTDVPLAVDADGNPATVQQFVGYSQIAAYMAEGDTVAQARNKAVQDAVNAKLQAEAAGLEPAPAAPTGLAGVRNQSVPMDRELGSKRQSTRALKRDFKDALDSQDWDRAQQIIDTASGLFGVDDSRVRNAIQKLADARIAAVEVVVQ